MLVVLLRTASMTQLSGVMSARESDESARIIVTLRPNDDRLSEVFAGGMSPGLNSALLQYSSEPERDVCD